MKTIISTAIIISFSFASAQTTVVPPIIPTTAPKNSNVSVVDYAVLSGYDYYTFTWQSPEKSVFSLEFGKLIPAMGCGENSDGWYGLYKCVGSQGWELVLKEETKTSLSSTQYWIFKRNK